MGVSRVSYINFFSNGKSDDWYQSFFTKKKKGKNKGWNAKRTPQIDKEKSQ